MQRLILCVEINLGVKKEFYPRRYVKLVISFKYCSFYKKHFYLAFIDFKQAFNILWRKCLWYKVLRISFNTCSKYFSLEKIHVRAT